MTAYITDTHSLLWYLGGSPLLGANARSAFDEAAAGSGQVSVPAIVLAELIMLVEKRRRAVDAASIFAAVQAAPGFRFTSLTPQTALRIQSLTTLPDIHDRLIVAEAIETGATLITRDQAVTASGLVPVVW
jgi:PIN domain nuclease of toxin-antitoxin system